jgi:hypothetical protein
MVAVLLAIALSGLPVRPDKALTPGDTVQVSVRDVCTPGYSGRVRHVTQRMKADVFRRYGIPQSGAFEVDHFISLELGGSNDISNLWPQSYTTRPHNARTKDALENRLHWLVCHGQMTLEFAQEALRSDWIAGYRLYVVENATGDVRKAKR